MLSSLLEALRIESTTSQADSDPLGAGRQVRRFIAEDLRIRKGSFLPLFILPNLKTLCGCFSNISATIVEINRSFLS